MIEFNEDVSHSRHGNNNILIDQKKPIESKSNDKNGKKFSDSGRKNVNSEIPMNIQEVKVKLGFEAIDHGEHLILFLLLYQFRLN